MFYVDHQRLNPPHMVCPMLPAPLPPSAPRQCIREQCALWYQERNPDYSGCSLFITAHAARGIGYHAARMADE